MWNFSPSHIVLCHTTDEISAHQTIATAVPALLFPAKVENNVYKYEHRYKVGDFLIEKKIKNCLCCFDNTSDYAPKCLTDQGYED